MLACQNPRNRGRNCGWGIFKQPGSGALRSFFLTSFLYQAAGQAGIAAVSYFRNIAVNTLNILALKRTLNAIQGLALGVTFKINVRRDGHGAPNMLILHDLQLLKTTINY